MDPEPVVLPIGKGELLREGEDVALIAVGRMVTYAREAAELLDGQGVSAAVVDARFIKPLDVDLIGDLVDRVDAVVTIEENAVRGGFGAGVLEFLSESGRHSVKTLALGLPDSFVGHGDLGRLLEEIDLDSPAIARRTLALLQGREAGVSAASSVS
jgi:1-deoxy-D-xylulose-5-phosphate synthase